MRISQVTHLEKLCRREEQICLALVRCLTDLAFALVRLAELEIAREDGNTNEAGQLVASAAKSYQTAVEFLEDTASEAEAGRAELEERVYKLSRAIRAADWHRRQASGSIVRGLRLVDGRNGRVN